MTGDRHPDTVILDDLTAFLNREADPSGADVVSLLSALISGSGRPLLDEAWEIDAEVTETRHGLQVAAVTADKYVVRVYQPTDRTADLRVDVSTEDGDDFGLAVTVNGRPVLDPMTFTWTSTVPPDLQLTKETHR
ncbi:hypothetical protein ACI2K4_22240 [Micromonospora sp. NPDC050397]|uniref:hypothetical protein n=1 Tax=Micromonospora sp. NPDC050397 TaxID=3364279 RepID=UPI00385009FC